MVGISGREGPSRFSTNDQAAGLFEEEPLRLFPSYTGCSSVAGTIRTETDRGV